MTVSRHISKGMHLCNKASAPGWPMLLAIFGIPDPSSQKIGRGGLDHRLQTHAGIIAWQKHAETIHKYNQIGQKCVMHKRNVNITLVLTTSTRHRYTGVWHRSGRSKTLDIANAETIQKHNEI